MTIENITVSLGESAGAGIANRQAQAAAAAAAASAAVAGSVMKADLVGGTVPLSQLPPGLGGDAADVGFDVILVAGQSNAVGNGASFDAQLDAVDSRVWQWCASGAYSGQVIPALDPLYHPSTLTGRIGFAVAFARLYAASIQQNRRVLLVPAAVSGTAFTTGAGDWVAGAPGGVLYEQAVSLATSAVGRLSTNRLVGVLWLQGESDGSLTQAQYETHLDALIAGFRARIPTASTSWFVLGTMTPERQATQPAIHAAHVATPVRNARAALFAGQPGYGNSGDTLHYSALGQRYLGLAAASAIAIAKANTTVGAYVAPAAPAQVTGVALVASATSITVTWTALTTAPLDYCVQYRVSGAGSWTTLQRPYSLRPTATIVGVTGSTTYEVQIAGVGLSGVGTWSATVSATTPASKMLDALTATPSAAFSLRRIRSAYTGNAIVVRRSSDNATQAIGYLPDDSLDTASLLAFVGSGDGFITTWYDQVGNNTATQATTTRQPKIVSAGALITRNGKPSARFVTADQTTLNAAAGWPANADYGLSVVGESGSSTGNFVASGGHTLWLSSGTAALYGGGTIAADSGALTQNVLHTLGASFIHSTKAGTFRRDGAQTGSGTGTTANTLSTINIGVFSAANSPLQGYVSEIVLTTGAPTAGDWIAIQSSQQAFYATA